VHATDGMVRICHAGAEVARHLERRGRRERAIEPGHLAGIVARLPGQQPVAPIAAEPFPDPLLRPLAEYEQVAGGGW
jgi:hypothetical protein